MRVILRIVKILIWTVMAVVLSVIGTSLCAVHLLDSKALTPLVEKLANDNLNATLTVRRCELSMRGSFPFLTLDVDSLTLLSNTIMQLPPEVRDSLPPYADTLLCFDHLRGSINITALINRRVALGDVVFTHPGVNIVVVADSINNFDIMPSSEPDEHASKLPAISIRRFAIVDARTIHFYDRPLDTHLEVDLKSIVIEGVNSPRYTCQLRGAAPLPGNAERLLTRLPFALDGDVVWNHDSPYSFDISKLHFDFALVSGRLNTSLHFGKNLMVNSFDLQLDPLSVRTLLRQLPDSLRTAWQLPPDFDTDMQPAVTLHLDRPYDTGTGQLPWLTANVAVAPAYIVYEGHRINDFHTQAVLTLRGDDLTAATVDLPNLEVYGPATSLVLSGTLQGLDEDPLFDATLRSNTDIAQLPHRLRALLGGYASGRLTTDLSLRGRPSMFRPGSYYRLHADGRVEGTDLYYLSADTANMVYVSRASIDFGNRRKISDLQGNTLDNMLRITIEVDSANVLHTKYAFTSRDIRLNLATKNQQRNADTTAITPMGGSLTLASFNFNMLSDSITVRARNLAGRMAMRGSDGDLHRPAFDFNLDIRRMATGDPSTRFVLSRSHLDFSMSKLPGEGVPREVRRLADSITRVLPDIPADSVYALAVQKYRKRPRKGPGRVHAEYNRTTDDEIIDWGTSRQLRRLLLDWKLDGRLTSDRVSLFTPYFPMRNRLRNFNVSFNNDSVQLNDIEYKIGHSDFLVSGRISNIKNGLTSRRGRQAIRANFDVVSDTIDINQLADLTFRGAAYRDAKERRRFGVNDFDHGDEKSLDEALDRFVTNLPDTAAPLLIPRNLDARINLRANHVLYSDLQLDDFAGQALIYNGTLNLHNLRAASAIGAVEMDAMYTAPNAHDLGFGFGLNVERFNIDGFLRLVPAIDSIMPLIRDLSGTINANIAATVRLHPNMDFNMNSLHAAISIDGEKLTLIDPDTYRTLGKWLLFHDKTDNVIRHMNVEMVVDSGMMEVYPFVFDLDRYRLGVQGYNTLDMDFDYHIAVLKSPLPFKFGINIKGTPEKYKVRLGKARFNERQAIERRPIANDTRLNLVRQIEAVFHRGLEDSRFRYLQIDARPRAASIDLSADTLTRADSLQLIREGLIIN